MAVDTAATKRNAHAPRTPANTRSTTSITPMTARRTVGTRETKTTIASSGIEKIATKMSPKIHIMITSEAGMIGGIMIEIEAEADSIETDLTEGHVREITAETMTIEVEGNNRSQSKIKTLTTNDGAKLNESEGPTLRRFSRCRSSCRSR